MNQDENYQHVLDFFRALSDENRLRVAGALAGQARTVDELASELDLTRPVLARHLALLCEVGIVREHGEGAARTYQLDVDALRTLRRTVLARGERLPASAADLDDERRKVLRAFLDGERLKSLPVDGKKMLIVLEWLVEHFERDTRYPEREVNETIKRHHPDYATLRRELVDCGLMQREASVYWRVDADA